jgi:hypothetical protein
MEDLEELHRLYLKAGGKLDLGTFRANASAECGCLTPHLMSPLLRAFGLTDMDSAAPPVIAYRLGSAR